MKTLFFLCLMSVTAFLHAGNCGSSGRRQSSGRKAYSNAAISTLHWLTDPSSSSPNNNCTGSSSSSGNYSSDNGCSE